MIRRAQWAVLMLTIVLFLSACNRAPRATDETGVDFGDPEVGGGAGQDTGPQTPIPTATPTREGSPRIDGDATIALPQGTPAEGEPQNTAGPAPTIEALPTATAEVAPTATPIEILPSATPTAEPPTAPPEPSPTPAGERIHVVQAGENLYRIGLIYGLSWVVIAEYNGITDPNQITVGQELRIPPSPTATPETGAGADNPAATGAGPDDQAAGPVVHRVGAGDTLYGISRHYGVNWAQIAEANGLSAPNQIYIGQPLKIPEDVPGPTPAFSHQVHAGETLSRIAAQYGLSAAELAEANGLGEPFVIYSGQVLLIPGE